MDEGMDKEVVDFRTNREKRLGWWVETRSTIPCIVDRDGWLVYFRRKDAEEVMDKTYPWEEKYGEKGGKVWYFNETKDREIAETDGDKRIAANPQVLWTLFWKG